MAQRIRVLLQEINSKCSKQQSSELFQGFHSVLWQARGYSAGDIKLEKKYFRNAFVSLNNIMKL